MAVAQERYFYQVHELTEQEVNFMYRFINEKTPVVIRDFCFDLLKLYSAPTTLKSIVTDKGIAGKDIDEIVRSTEINTFEDIHCIFEGFGEKILQCKSIKYLQSMEDEDWDKALTLSLILSATASFAQTSGENKDKQVIFRFVSGNDIFYVPWNGNGETLDALCADIDVANLNYGVVKVDGYSETKSMSLIRCNRVKSELIIRKGMSEQHFTTTNCPLTRACPLTRPVLRDYPMRRQAPHTGRKVAYCP